MNKLEMDGCPLVYVEESVARQICVNDVFVNSRTGVCHVFHHRPKSMVELRDEWSPQHLKIEDETIPRACYRLSHQFNRVGIVAGVTSVESFKDAVQEAMAAQALAMLPHGSQVDVHIRLPLIADHIKITVVVGKEED